MIFKALAMFMCGMFLAAFFGTTVACTIALMKSFFSKPFVWGDSLALCMVLFMSAFALIGTYSIIAMIGIPT